MRMRRSFPGNPASGWSLVPDIPRHRKHVLNLYVWPAPGTQESGMRAMTRQGFQMMSWTQQRMHFVAISDMSAQDLAGFAKALEAQVAQGGAGG